ncbi:GAF and ANTAR domain-containing protein [Actinomycetospora cinnamomea]|uniref:GAF domain-containing protein n=1 Tax=Actinomycetospora cinnamomea TaxID=663609 RepID=A0A2U1FL86_9PSEU|nr:GAF and ANTAR domain-containing protein [Actinomycetospora cinnamomea]PVZ12944.1 GAF domain-containing protein [Actinomycetospora cinnamomea]
MSTTSTTTDDLGGASAREASLLTALVGLARTLVSDYDVVDVLDQLTARCVELLDVDAAGLMLAGHDGGLEVMSSSSEQAHQLELHQLRDRQGPCVDAYRTGVGVHADDVAAHGHRWPEFAAHARELGIHGVHALPLRCNERAIGAMNLFTTTPRPFPDADVHAAQALADVATTVVLQHRTLGEAQLITEQLRTALDSRIIIEQAKGALAERGGLSADDAFARMRRHARRHHLKVTAVAQAVMSDAIDTAALLRG